jgi:tetratricopeptide (TPR) repeat protein
VDGPRNLPRRQQTLRAAIDWSYQLLEPSEQRLFASLSVFAGGWTIDAAQAVGHDSAPESSVAAVLAALLDKSLIRLTDSGAAPRFVMLETIQSYAREQLARSGALEPCHERHAMYYVALAEQSEEPLAGAEAGIWLDRLDQEHDNLRTALSWALDNAAEQRLALALRLCSVLGRFWRMRGYLREGRRWLERVLATTGPHPPALRAKVLWSAGILARMQGDLTAAAELLGEALTLYNGLDDTLGIALALTSLGTLSFEQSDYDRAQTCFEESLTRYQQLGDTRRVGIALNNLGNIAYKKGDLEQAEARYRAALELLTGDAADQQMIALIMTNLGEIARLHKNYRQACQLLAESAEIYRTLNDNQGLLLCLNNLAEIAIDLGHAELAAELLGAMEALYEQLDAVRSPDQASDYERQVAAVRSQLDARVFEAAWRRGRTLPIDDVLKRAVGDDI